MRARAWWLPFAAWAAVTVRIFASSHAGGVAFAVVTIAVLLAEGRAHFARVRRGSRT